MTIAADAASLMIGEWGEEVTVVPQASDEPEDESNPVFFKESESDAASFTRKVRLYTALSEEDLMEYGFEPDGDAIIYTDKDGINDGDEIQYSDLNYTVRNTRTNQHGNGQYLYLHELVEKQ